MPGNHDGGNHRQPADRPPSGGGGVRYMVDDVGRTSTCPASGWSRQLSVARPRPRPAHPAPPPTCRGAWRRPRARPADGPPPGDAARWCPHTCPRGCSARTPPPCFDRRRRHPRHLRHRRPQPPPPRPRHGRLVMTEVGSPKDHPGTWAGYAVHETRHRADGARGISRSRGDPLDRAHRWRGPRAVAAVVARHARRPLLHAPLAPVRRTWTVPPGRSTAQRPAVGKDAHP